MTTVSRHPINSLQLHMQNTIIIGIIIRSQNSKIIDPAKTRYNVGSRAVWNFTLRDSINDFINATVWGAIEYINQIFSTFNIGSVVEIINAKITERKLDDPNVIYVPSVTSPFTLCLNQNSSLIQMHSSPAVPRYKMLLRIPTKNPAGSCNLEYILENAESLRNQYVDVIVAVTFISQTREIVTRLGELTKIREFEVGDESIDQTVSLTLWDIEWIKLADTWEPRHTVLFLADTQIIFNERAKKSTLNIVRKTIITENPDIPETNDIRNYFQSKTDLGSTSPFAIPNPNSITKKMTIRDITNKLNHINATNSNNRLQLLVVVNAIVDDMNLEGDDLPILSARCAKCKRVVLNGNDSCMNLECPFGSGIKSPMNTISLNILVTLKDETGYLVGCRLRDAAAEQAIGCTIDVLQEMPYEQRIKLKGKYCKRLCNIRMQIVGPSATFHKPIYNILAISIIHCDDEQYEAVDFGDLNMNYELD